MKVEHHVFFSVSATRSLRRALAQPRTVVPLSVSSALSADLDGDGDTDGRSSETSSQVLADPTTRRSPALVNHQTGLDPCGARGLPASTCLNVRSGQRFVALHFWDTSGTVRIDCPPEFRYPTGSVSIDTIAKAYTESVTTPGSPDRTEVFVTDSNPKGHPYIYRFTAACSSDPKARG